eukprot:CAMPEP_0175873592 /NCGR_PEP_ID=MMETSP0107_2-20121207/38397_1 /TAXON_ID=195067 ORGANISM="Goniomonas pacifica, Strain CCMP1869" /NCGR_SAMPLE_ID=MMETSP0107_2 /ASSEMBLY_ACC=CAM_ASM_000203 /LENGTH=203 /DNA_ID=CAMNT_0017192341 /DNA_START=9 /DNA_END=618 /DNA_ORIENTATION=-
MKRMTVYVTEERRHKLLTLATDHYQRYREADTAPLGEVQSLVGKLVWSAVACPAGYAYARRLWDAVSSVPMEGRMRHSKHPMTLTPDYWDDMTWWIKALGRPIEAKLTPRYGDGRLEIWDGDPLGADTIITTDAADNMWGSVVFPKDFRPADLLVAPTVDEVTAGLKEPANMEPLGSTSDMPRLGSGLAITNRRHHASRARHT